ncbi:MAG: hypothetical protein JO124_09765 [Hyphomicrobiales bacterium]|nr:hypothetical protein [Hyphomicrobiales bacterium]
MRNSRRARIEEVEDMVALRLRQHRPDIERISIENGPVGWRCARITRALHAPKLSRSQAEMLFAEATVSMALILRFVEIEVAPENEKTPAEVLSA